MPYPPNPPRKYATDEEANAARVQHLLPYRFEPGQSGNLSGMSAEQHQFYCQARSLMRDVRKIGAVGLTGLRVDAVRIGRAEGRAEHVRGDDEQFVGVDRLARP